MKNLLVIYLTLWSFFLSLPAHAGTSSASGWVDGISSTGQRIWFGPNLQTKGSATMGNAIWNTAVNGVQVVTSPTISTASGDIALVTRQAVSGAESAAAIGRFLSKVTTPLVVGLAVYDLAKELGFELNRSSDGSVRITKPAVVDPNVCTVAPCYAYIAAGWYGPSREEACGKFLSAWGTGGTSERYFLGEPPFTTTGGSKGFGVCTVTVHRMPANTLLRYETASFERSPISPAVPGSPSSPDVVSQQQFLDAVATKSGWPTTSRLADAVKDAVNSGESVAVTPVSNSGPASVTGPPTVTSSNDGTNTTTTTTTPKSSLQYGNSPRPSVTPGAPGSSGGTDPSPSVPSVTATAQNTSVTTVTNNSTGVTNTTNTTVETKPDTPSKEPDYSFSDSDFPAIPKLYERKYPDGFVGVWNSKIALIKAAPLFTLVANLMPSNIGATGQCPSFIIPANFGKWGEFGNLDFSPPCMVWDFGKVIIIISALLLSRRLIFGG